MEKSRTIVISDIHGKYEAFKQLLNHCVYNPVEDQLILLGDYVDRGRRSKETVELVKQLHDEHGAIVLMGNHEQMMIDSLLGKGGDALWLHNGGIQTVESYVGINWFVDQTQDWWNLLEQAKEFIVTHYSHHIDFLSNLSLYHEDENHIYVHAGISALYEHNWKSQPDNEFLWVRNMFLDFDLKLGKTIVFGHTPTITIQDSEDIYFGEERIGIDGGACFGYQLNGLIHYTDPHNKKDVVYEALYVEV